MNVSLDQLVRHSLELLDQLVRYSLELLGQGFVTTSSQIATSRTWTASRGVRTNSAAKKETLLLLFSARTEPQKPCKQLQ